MDITFDEIGHTYTRRGKIVPNVTSILGAVYGTGLEGAPMKYVKPATEKGKIGHKEFENYLKNGVVGSSKEFVVWHEWFNYIEDFLVNYECEKIIFGETPSGCFAGTADFIANGFVYDWKTSKTATRAQIIKWQRQLSFYIYALRQMGYAINEPAKIVHITENVCVIPVAYLGDKWVEKTMELYKDILAGKKTQQDAILSEQKALEKVSAKEIKTLENTMLKIVELEKKADEIKERIKEEMGKRGILSLNFGKVKMTYVAEHIRRDFNKKDFKEDEPELYEQYLTEVKVKPSLRVTIKENEND